MDAPHQTLHINMNHQWMTKKIETQRTARKKKKARVEQTTIQMVLVKFSYTMTRSKLEMDSRGRGGDDGVRRGCDGRSDVIETRGGAEEAVETERMNKAEPPLRRQQHRKNHFQVTPCISPISPLGPPPHLVLQCLRCKFQWLHLQTPGSVLITRFSRIKNCTIQSASSARARLTVVRHYWQKLGPADIQKRRKITYTVYQQGSLPGPAQNQGLPQQAQAIDSQGSKISSQHPAFNPQNFNGDPNHDQLPEEGRKTTTTAENTGGGHIQRTQPANNITSRTQQVSREEPVIRR